jgi:hypothetical protein
MPAHHWHDPVTGEQEHSSLAVQPTSTGTVSLAVPVLFIVFNRSRETARVFEAIRHVRPERLYVAADGPRKGRPEEARKCEEVRAIVGGIDWRCEVNTLFSSENLGCKQAVSSAITWFFDNESEGIILEDDCLPSPSFFWFCQELLARYRDDERVWQVCGTSILKPSSYSQTEDSYIFSRYGPVWGWATWRRAWVHYDANLTDWLYMRRPQPLNSVFKSAPERRFWLDLGNKLHRGQIDTWDYQWDFTKAYQSGLSVIPCENMIVNIGFGSDATHTFKAQRWVPHSMSDVRGPIKHPRYVIIDEAHDLLYRRKVRLGSRRARAKNLVSTFAKWWLQPLRHFSNAH